MRISAILQVLLLPNHSPPTLRLLPQVWNAEEIGKKKKNPSSILSVLSPSYSCCFGMLEARKEVQDEKRRGGFGHLFFLAVERRSRK
jgi:hypothetical protein